MMRGRGFARVALWNALMAALVFSPTLVIASPVEVWLRGGHPLNGPLTIHLGMAIVLYASLLLPSCLGSAVASAGALAGQVG